MEATCCGDQYHSTLAQTYHPSDVNRGRVLETTNFAVVASGYLLDLCDPVLGVWLEVGCIRILPGRHDEDAGVGDKGVSQAHRDMIGNEKSYSLSLLNSCSLPSASTTVCVR